MCILKVDTSPVSLVLKASTRIDCDARSGQSEDKMVIRNERKTIMKTIDFTKICAVDIIPMGMFCSGDEIPSGTFHS